MKKTKYIKIIVSIFLSVIASLYTFVEIQDRFSNRLHLWLFLILCALVTSLISFFVYRQVYIESDPNYKMKKELLTEKRLLSNYIKKAELQNNLYKLHFLKWRIIHENKKFERVISGTFSLPILPLYCYMRSVFTEMINMLQEGDEYYSISTYSFWKEDDVFEINPGIEKVDNYLAENVESIRVKKTIIHRIIIFDSKILEASTSNKDRKRLETLVTDFNKALKLTEEEKIRFKILFYKSDNYKADIAKYSAPFGFIKRSNTFLVKAVPINLEPDGTKMPSIIFDFFDNKTNDKEFRTLDRNFHELKDDCITIQQMYIELNINS